MSFIEFMNAGEKLGLEGPKLREFAETQLHQHIQNKKEEEKVKEREHERELKLIAAKEREYEIKREEQERELTIIAEKQKLCELEKGKPSNTKSHDTPRHRFPTFNEKIDDLDTFFQSFENQAKLLKIKDTELKSYLLSSLSGKARDIFNSLPFETDYETTKKVLLNKFNFTPNFYRKKFFSTCPSSEENTPIYIHRLSRYFDRWISLSETTKDYDSLRELMIKHTFLSSCNVKLSQFLLEKDTKNIEDLITESERFFSAHEGETLGNKEPFPLIANSSFKERSRYSNRSHSVEPDKSFNKFRYRSRSADNTKPYYKNSNFNNSSYNKGKFEKSETKSFHNSKSHKKFDRSQIKCFTCSGFGHVASDCPTEVSSSFASIFNWREKNDFSLDKPDILHSFSSICSSNEHHIYNGLLGHGNPKPIRVLRDTGSMVHGIHKDLVQSHEYLNDSISVITFGGKKETLPLARIFVNTPFIEGFIIACVIENNTAKLYDVLIGNGTTPCTNHICLPTPDIIQSWENNHKHYFKNDDTIHTHTVDDLNLTDSYEDHNELPTMHCNQVTTRAQAKDNDPTILSNKKLINFDISDEEFSTLQKDDPSLNRYFKIAMADTKINKHDMSSKKHCFIISKGKLVRLSKDKNQTKTQLIMPTILRNRALSLSHDTPQYAHGGIHKTYYALSQDFFWPGMYRDVKSFCKTCDTCQRTTKKGRNVKAPLQTPDDSNKRITYRPFEKIAIDIIGELPMSKYKNRYILTVIDCATRWTEAIPLKSIETIVISEALCSIFSRFGFPRVILSDNGPQFVSNIMKQVMTIFGITHNRATPYHPQTNGLCERVNGTIKDNIRKAAFDNKLEWDRVLPFTLFNIRSSPQETTKYTPFELVYGFPPKTLHSLIKDSWLENVDNFDKPEEQYVLDLRDRILKSCAEADEATYKQQIKSKARYDKTSKIKSLNIGDRVLLLLSKHNNKLEKQWEGPYEVIEVISPVNYKININNKHKIFHINMLQKYHSRTDNLSIDSDMFANVGIIEDEADDCQHLTHIELPPANRNETWLDVKINPDLNDCDNIRIKKNIT